MLVECCRNCFLSAAISVLSALSLFRDSQTWLRLAVTALKSASSDSVEFRADWRWSMIDSNLVSSLVSTCEATSVRIGLGNV